MTPAEGQAAYDRLFRAHVLGLLATGVATVALALLAYDLAGEESGAVLGTALALKMAVNILVTPLVAGLRARMPTRRKLSRLLVLRAATLLLVPFVTEIWQIYVLIVLFQTASAAFVAIYLATVPELLADETAYARAVAKSKIAYDVESLASPLVVAALVLVVDFRGVFVAAAVLLALAVPVIRGARFPVPGGAETPGLGTHLSNAGRLFTVAELRAGLALTVAALVIGAMVTVNTVVLVRGAFGLGDEAAAIALAAYGAGGVAAALVLHRLTGGGAERGLMLASAGAMAVLLTAGAALPGYGALLPLWVGLGIASTLAQLPFAALIRRNSSPGERQGLYAAHYAVSHAVQLVAYLAAGWIAAEGGMAAAFVGLGLFSALMVLLARLTWPVRGSAAG